MTMNRRRFLRGTTVAALFAGQVVAAPKLAFARNGTSVLRAVMHGDLRSFDPVWTTATITGYHAAMVYDTLFGIDAAGEVKPQMIGSWSRSEDGLRYDFTLRDGLVFSDGTAVMAADCVASMKRWAARDTAGQIMFDYVTDVPVTGEASFALVLSAPWGLVLETLAKTSNCLWIMRESDAMTPPDEQISEIVGSGPFTFNRDETKMGVAYVYDRNPSYVPREEAPSGTTGAKIAKVDRVVWENISDPQTALAALQAGEIDFYETPPLDLLPQLETDPDVKVELLNDLGIIGFVRLNHLHPPFNHPKARQAMLYIVNQLDIMRATYGDERYFGACPSLWGCGTTMETDVNTDWFTHGQDFEKAAELFREAGYDGEPVTILQGTTLPMPNMAAQLIAQWLRKAGINAELAPSDWGGVVARRAVKAPPSEGGWNVFITYNPTSTFNSPILFPGWQMNGEAGFFGWPDSPEIETMRKEWTFAANNAERRRVAERIQQEGWDFVPHVLAGQWKAPVAMRSKVTGFLPIPDLVPFWNVEKA